MIIDLSSRMSDEFDDKSEYSKIQLVGEGFKELELSPEEELIVKKFLYYSENVSGHGNASKLELSTAYRLLMERMFVVFNKKYALNILEHLGNDLAQNNISEACLIATHLSGVFTYADAYKTEGG